MGRLRGWERAPAMGAVLMSLATSASAGVSLIDLGLAAPPPEIGGYTMDGFTDPSPLGDLVFGVTPPATSPVVGDLLFNELMEHQRVGSGWDTWSHPYSGDVYWFDEIMIGNVLVLTLPLGTMAFHFYLEPDFFGTASFLVSSGGETLLFDVDGDGGARGVGFYSDDPVDPLTAVVIEKVSVDFMNGFGIGEFGINATPVIPEGSGAALMAGGILAGLMALRWRASR